MSRIVVHIESLVLKGFRHEDRHAIAEGLRQELVRLLADPKAAQGLTALNGVARMNAGSTPTAYGSAPAKVGAQVARKIGGGLKR